MHYLRSRERLEKLTAANAVAGMTTAGGVTVVNVGGGGAVDAAAAAAAAGTSLYNGRPDISAALAAAAARGSAGIFSTASAVNSNHFSHANFAAPQQHQSNYISSAVSR